MKPVYQCEYCDCQGDIETIAKHEIICKKNPINIEKKEKLKWIAEHCPYRKECWDEYDNFWGCVKNEPYGYGGRHTPGCYPCADCLQYCEGENLWNHVT